MIGRIILNLLLAVVLACCVIITVLLVVDPQPNVIACAFITYCNTITTVLCWYSTKTSNETIRILESLER